MREDFSSLFEGLLRPKSNSENSYEKEEQKSTQKRKQKPTNQTKKENTEDEEYSKNQ